MCLVGAGAAGPLRGVRDTGVVDARGGDRADVRRAAGLRSPELRAQAADQGGAALSHERQGLWHAQQPRAVRRLFRRLRCAVPTRAPLAAAVAAAVVSLR